MRKGLSLSNGVSYTGTKTTFYALLLCALFSCNKIAPEKKSSEWDSWQNQLEELKECCPEKYQAMNKSKCLYDIFAYTGSKIHPMESKGKIPLAATYPGNFIESFVCEGIGDCSEFATTNALLLNRSGFDAIYVTVEGKRLSHFRGNKHAIVGFKYTHKTASLVPDKGEINYVVIDGKVYILCEPQQEDVTKAIFTKDAVRNLKWWKKNAVAVMPGKTLGVTIQRSCKEHLPL